MTIYKVCRKCKISKPRDIEFYSFKNKCGNRQFQSYCKECNKQLSRERGQKLENKRKRSIYGKLYRSKEEVQEREKEYRKRYYEENKDSLRQRHKDYYNQNRDEINALQRERRLTDDSLLKRFNITRQEYNKTWMQQNGVCAICKISCDGILHLDHSHKSGKFRGLLCSNCNKGLGFFKDNPETLVSAILYLNTHKD
jgi:hypothetical protein